MTGAEKMVLAGNAATFGILIGILTVWWIGAAVMWVLYVVNRDQINKEKQA